MSLARVGWPAFCLALALVALASGPTAAQLVQRAPPKQKGPEPNLGKAGRVIGRLTTSACHVAVSPDGKIVAAPDGEGKVHLWDLASGKELRQWQAEKGFLREVAFSPDGKLLASGGNSAEICLWDSATGKEVRRLPGHQGGLYVAVFAPDGKTLITGGFDEHIRFWDLTTGKEIRAIRAHKRVIYALALSPDGKTLASGGDTDRFIQLWDPATGKEIRRWDAHRECVYSVDFSADGKLLASGGGDPTARIWEVATGKEVRRLEGHNSSVFRVSFSPDGRLVGTASYTRKVHAWELASGSEVYAFDPHRNWVWGLAFTPDGKTLLSAGDDGLVLSWNLLANIPPNGPGLTAQKSEELWRDLAGGNTARAFEAIRILAADPGKAVATLKDRLRPAEAPRIDKVEVGRRIADLDSDTYDVREKARLYLENVCPAIEPELRRALVKPASLEAQRRLEALLARCTRETPTPEQLRALRGVQVLELVNSPEALKVLEKLQKGDPDALLTREVQTVLARLRTKKP